MGWLMSFVALSLAIVVLTTPVLRQAIKGKSATLPALRISEHLITGFVFVTSAAGFAYGVALLASKILF
jgi:hypothetical protein